MMPRNRILLQENVGPWMTTDGHRSVMKKVLTNQVSPIIDPKHRHFAAPSTPLCHPQYITGVFCPIEDCEADILV
jgi:hypothetical protein